MIKQRKERKMQSRRHTNTFWFLLLVATATANDISPLDNSNLPDDDFDRSYGIFDWINDGGYFNPKQEFRPNTKTNFTGIYAKVDIPKGEILCTVPHDHKIIPNIGVNDDTSDCDTANQLAEYMRHPLLYPEYLPYSLYTRKQRRGQLPSWFSASGKRLLLQLLNDELLPTESTTILEEWYDECRDYGSFIQDEWWSHAAMLVQQRADDDIIIPAYDMYNHRNGAKYLNTQTEWNQDDALLSPHITVASQDISAGDQIYNSYNMCVFCFGRKNGGYGTPEIFRDYGFVENYPQRWMFTKKERRTNGRDGTRREERASLEFDLEEMDGTTNEGDSSSTLIVKWILKPKKVTLPQLEWVVFLESQLQRLEQFQVVNDDTNTASADVNAAIEKEGQTAYELEMIEIFRQANIVAITHALQSLATMSPDEYDDDDHDEDENEDENDDDDEDEDDDDDPSEREL